MSEFLVERARVAARWVRREAPALIELERQRLADRHFWGVIALVLALSGLHMLMEMTHPFGSLGAIAFIPVSMYLIPALYAGLVFGTSGALPTVALAAFLTLPNAYRWHEGAERLGELFQVGVIAVTAMMVARRTARESAAKHRTADMSAQLAHLNATAEAAAGSLDPPQVVHDVLAAIMRDQRFLAAWVTPTEAGAEYPPAHRLTRIGAPNGSIDASSGETNAFAVLARAWKAAQRMTAGMGAARVPNTVRAVVVPVRSAGVPVGELGVVTDGPSLVGDDVVLLDAMAHQLAVALANARHLEDERNARAELQLARAKLEAYLLLAIDAQEEERRRLARELHDDTIQSLIVIKGRLEEVVAGPRLTPEASSRLAISLAIIERSIDEVRRFCRDLRPSLLDDLGLAQAIDWLAGDLSRRTGIQTVLEVENETVRLEPRTEAALFRIIQEALRNVERHSGATEVSILLSFGPKQVTIVVTDNGRGFDAGPHVTGHGDSMPMGLTGMQERARLLGGAFILDSPPGGGVSICVSVPRREPAAEADSPASATAI